MFWLITLVTTVLAAVIIYSSLKMKPLDRAGAFERSEAASDDTENDEDGADSDRDAAEDDEPSENTEDC